MFARGRKPSSNFQMESILSIFEKCKKMCSNTTNAENNSLIFQMPQTFSKIWQIQWLGHYSALPDAFGFEGGVSHHRQHEIAHGNVAPQIF
jgi:hypothetical protein